VSREFYAHSSDQNLVCTTHAGNEMCFPANMSPTDIDTEISNFSVDLITDVTSPKKVLPQESPDDDFSWIELGSEVALTTAGALAGQRLTRGAPAPVQFAATTAGAALGTAGFNLADDVAKGQSMDYSKAVKEALISAGFDVATLGAQRLLPTTTWVKTMEAFGIDPNKTASTIMAQLGSPEAMEQTQAFLRSKGMGLLPSQLREQAGWVDKLREKIGRLGVVSRSSFDDYAGAVNTAVREEFDNLFNVSANRSISSIGDHLNVVYDTAQKALSKQYVNSLESLAARTPVRYTNVNPIRLELDKIFKEYGVQGVNKSGELVSAGSTLQNETREFLQSHFAKFAGDDGIVALDAKNIIALEKTITSAQSQLMDNGLKTAAKEVRAIGERMKEPYLKMMENIDPNLAVDYKKIKESYKKGQQAMFPEITGNKLRKALDNGDLFPIAKAVLTGRGSAKQVKELMGSITQVYGTIRHTNPKEYKKILAEKGLPETPQEFKKMLRESYLLENFPNLMNADESVSTMATKMANMFVGEATERTKAIFGDQFKDLKRMVNIVDIVSRDSKGNIADLFGLSQQYQKAGTVVNAMSALAVGGSAVNGLGMGELSIAAAVLLTPHYMTKAVMNPKLGDRILKIATGKFDKFKDMADIVNIAASNFVQGLTVEEQEQVVQYLQAMANQNERAELVEKTKNERIQ
jgi:hypothetical protein